MSNTTERTVKSLSARIYGTLREINVRESSQSIKIESESGLSKGCFLSSEVDYSHLIDKRVVCRCSLSHRPIGTETDILGYETIINVFEIAELPPRRKFSPELNKRGRSLT